ncbi:MAG: N5-glutamine methyltransferase family protein, partial [Desulfosudaceae bacterium]
LDRVNFFAADWAVGLRPGRAVFDMIVANPPYVSTGELPQLARDIRDYEPAIALDGGKDGLTQVRRLVYSAADFLSPRGLLLLEIGWDQKEAVAGLARETGSYATVDFVRDLAGHDRVALLRRKSAPTS